MPEFRTVRGMRDFLPEEARLMKYVESTSRRVADLYGYKEVITPIVEPYELLAAKAGDEVRSRMFIFKDLGGRDVALRPEFTASVARLVATTFRNEPQPFRLLTVGSIYRYDEPQRGRYREFWQANYELMGSTRPEADAEILMLTDALMKAAGLRKCTFKVGHVGVLRGMFAEEKLRENVQNKVMQLMDSKQYEDALREIAKAGVSPRCSATLRELVSLRGTNVFDVIRRIGELVEGYGKAVESVKNLYDVVSLLSESGCHVPMIIDAGFARGLEYYTGLIFEVYVPEVDKALGGGGRYDKLIESFGGKPTPAVGVAHGLDRIMLAMNEQKAQPKIKRERSVIVIAIEEGLRGEGLRISQLLREAGIQVEVEVMGRKMAKALEDADRKNIDFAVIVGEREMKEEAVVLRDLKKREQTVVKIGKLAQTVKD